VNKERALNNELRWATATSIDKRTKNCDSNRRLNQITHAYSSQTLHINRCCHLKYYHNPSLRYVLQDTHVSPTTSWMNRLVKYFFSEENDVFPGIFKTHKKKLIFFCRPTSFYEVGREQSRKGNIRLGHEQKPRKSKKNWTKKVVWTPPKRW
jgi:hypothetical protein